MPRFSDPQQPHQITAQHLASEPHTNHPSNSVNTAAWVDLRTYQPTYDRGRPGWYVLLWWLVQAIAFPLSLHPCNGWRCFWLRLFGANIGQGVVIRPSARFLLPWKVTIGDYSWIGDQVTFYSLEPITVGSHSVISQQTYLCTGSHDLSSASFALTTAAIAIGHGVWLATDCFVAPGVSIGSNTVVGTRSTVLKSLPEGQVAWGTPCKVRYRRMVAQT